jgi:hypothetical protein
MTRRDLGYPGGASVHAQASCSLMRVQTMHLLNAHPHPADPCPLPLWEPTDAFVEAYRQVCPRVIVDTMKRKFSPDRSRGILVASAVAVASFGIGAGANARIRKWCSVHRLRPF